MIQTKQKVKIMAEEPKVYLNIKPLPNAPAGTRWTKKKGNVFYQGMGYYRSSTYENSVIVETVFVENTPEWFVEESVLQRYAISFKDAMDRVARAVRSCLDK